jgi:periplasmic divalent cation tolerance protein
MEDTGIIIFCTFPNKEEAGKIAKVLVEKKLAACCTVFPEVTSFYTWKSKIEENNEIMLMIKTAKHCYEKLEKQIKMMHSYSVPEIISVNIQKGSKAYMDWIFESIKS